MFTEQLLLTLYSLIPCFAPLPADSALWIMLYQGGRGLLRGPAFIFGPGMGGQV